MSANSTTKIRWDGPSQQICYELGRHGYKAVVTPGAVYELPTSVAESLLRSLKHWSLFADSGPAVRRTDLEQDIPTRESSPVRPALKTRTRTRKSRKRQTR